MNGGQDLGGMQGFGPVIPEPDEPVFHHDWERRAFAVTLALGMLGRWNLDMSRFARENRDPAEYLALSYYELWHKGLERLAVEKGLVTAEELRAGRALEPRDPSLAAPDAATAMKVLANSRGAKLDDPVAPRFVVGERVRVKNLNPPAHTRMPRYCRGRQGVVHLDHGAYVFPDTHALGLGPKPQHCYSVRFSAGELWGEPRREVSRDSVHLDLWDDYLERA